MSFDAREAAQTHFQSLQDFLKRLRKKEAMKRRPRPAQRRSRKTVRPEEDTRFIPQVKIDLDVFQESLEVMEDLLEDGEWEQAMMAAWEIYRSVWYFRPPV